MLKLPLMLAGALAQSAELRARLALKKAQGMAVAGALIAGGAVFFLISAYLALAEAVGAIGAAAIVGAVLTIIGIGVLLYTKSKTASPAKVRALSAEAKLGRATLSASIDPASSDKTKRAPMTPAEAIVQAAMSGNYDEAVDKASAMGRELGKSVPPVALPIAGLAIGVALAWTMKKSDKED